MWDGRCVRMEEKAEHICYIRAIPSQVHYNGDRKDIRQM